MDERDDIKSLMTAVKKSRDDLKVFRKNRLAAIQQYVGHNYSNKGAGDRVPLNMIELGVTIYSQQLVASAPRALILTKYNALKAEAADFEAELNHQIETMGLEESLQEWVIEALFCVGVMKVGVADAGIHDLGDFRFEASQPYAEPVLFEDFVFDTSAKRYSKVRYAGDIYTMPLEEAKNNDLFDEELRAQLVPMSRRTTNDSGEERTTSITDESGAGLDEDYEPMVELLELWQPFKDRVITVPMENWESVAKPLRTNPWQGPPKGPYKFLSFSHVPGNVLPLAPVSTWMDLHDILNRLFRKTSRQAERAKQITGYQGDVAGDATRLKEAADGEMVRMDNPGGVTQFKSGGVDKDLLAFEIHVEQELSKFAGNLDALGGLSAQTDTVGQDKMLRENSSQRMQKMQRKVVRGVQEVMHDLAWYLWNDPAIQTPVVSRKMPGTDIQVPVDFSLENRRGQFFDYNIDIEPYSMSSQSPAERLNFVQGVYERFLLPILPSLQEQGITVNHEAFLELLSRYGNVPELLEILVFGGEPPARTAKGPVGGLSASSAPRTNTSVRVSRPGRTAQGHGQVMQQILMGAGVQPSEVSAVGRPAV